MILKITSYYITSCSVLKLHKNYINSHIALSCSFNVVLNPRILLYIKRIIQKSCKIKGF